jgi:peptide-methionine (S)-S-oxide reductase
MWSGRIRLIFAASIASHWSENERCSRLGSHSTCPARIRRCPAGPIPSRLRSSTSSTELGDGIYTTAVGYAGGPTPNPTYEEVCSGRTGHNEVVLVVYDPKKVSYETLLKTFWENHDPTQGMRQGNDVGTQYRSGIYTMSPAQKKAAEESKAMFAKALAAKRFGAITTEIVDAPPFYFAEDYHQQYLAKNPMGYCGLGGTGVSCPIGTGVGAAAAAG